MGGVTRTLSSCHDATGGLPFTLHFYPARQNRTEVHLAYPDLPPRPWKAMRRADFHALAAADDQERTERLRPYLEQARVLVAQWHALVETVQRGEDLPVTYIGDHDHAHYAAIDYLIRHDTHFSTTWYHLDEPHVRHRAHFSRSLTVESRGAPLDLGPELDEFLRGRPLPAGYRRNRAPAMAALEEAGQRFLASLSPAGYRQTTDLYRWDELALLGDENAASVLSDRAAQRSGLVVALRAAMDALPLRPAAGARAGASTAE